MMNRLMVLFFLVAVTTLVQPANASEYVGYEDIIRDLRGSTSAPVTSATDDDFSEIKIHGSVAMVSSNVQLSLPGNLPSSKSMRGAEASMGIDLFSPRWIAEGSVRSFNRENFGATHIALKEFDLKVVHKHHFSESIFARLGGGMAARYLDFEQAPAENEPASYTTPASVFVFGLGMHITSGMALSAELNYRAALIDETADEGSVDGALRFTGSF